jgi:hypothetical protein
VVLREENPQRNIKPRMMNHCTVLQSEENKGDSRETHGGLAIQKGDEGSLD